MNQFKESLYKMRRISEVCEVNSGSAFSKDHQGHQDKKIPFYKVGDMNNSEIYMKESDNYIDSNILEKLGASEYNKGSIIFPKIGQAVHTNKTRILSKNSCIDNNIMCLTPKKEIISKYLYYVFEAIDLSQFTRTATVPSIRKSEICEYKIPVPPLEEQERIVREIDERLDTITTLEHSINNIQQLSNEYEDSIINFLFAGRNFSSKDAVSSELQSSELPESWSIEKIDDCILSAKNGGTPKKSEDSYWNGETGWLNSGDVRGKYTSEPSDFITQIALDKTSAKLFEKGSVLVALYGGEGTIGRATILTKELSGNQAICSLVPDEEIIDIEYFYYCFKKLRPKLEYLARGGSQSNINQSIVRNQEIPVPPLEIQKEIVKKLEEIDFSKLENSIYTVDELAEEYKESVLSEAFSGGI